MMVVEEKEEEKEEEEEGACRSPQSSHLSKTHSLVASLLFLAWNGSESESERREGPLRSPRIPATLSIVLL